MREELKEIVEEYRNKGVPLTDEEADDVERYCYRKMEVAGIKDQEEYLLLLFPDEIRNYLFRLSVNATTILRMEGLLDVPDMQTVSV